MHGGRMAYRVMNEGILVEPPAVAAPGPQVAAPVKASRLKFGRLFDKRPDLPADEGAMVDLLIRLGSRMVEPSPGQLPADPGERNSDIPAGYTYLGQFIAHEITFDNLHDTLQPGMDPANLRTPQIDLDCLYGGAAGPGDEEYGVLYEADGASLKVGKTARVSPPGKIFPNDLPRDAGFKQNPKRALIADERNDENLTVAQTHVAFIRFHNRVVERLKPEGHSAADLFELARRDVRRHFQWIILHDYLPKIVDKDVLDGVVRDGATLFESNAVGDDGPRMPLEFSAAAFRIGHTMVRASYDWNKYHHKNDGFGGGRAGVKILFELTGFLRPRGQFRPLHDGFPSGMTREPDEMTPLLTLPSDWIIDWRRFYDFVAAGGPPQPGVGVNMASKLDTVLNFHLDKLRGFPDEKLNEMQKAITVRNLLRGFYLGLPTGEEVAAAIRAPVLEPDQVADGPQRDLLEDPLLRGKTPLWYYILKEAELLGMRGGRPGNRLGPVGSRIVAETLVGLIKKSPSSILADPGWYPKYGREVGGPEPVKFEMTDLLKFAFGEDPSGVNSVNPLG